MTDKTTEALKLAEEALEEFFYDAKEQPELWEALAAIREALAEQEKQEPVAIVDEIGKRLDGTYIFNAVGKVDVGQPLYAAPVSAKREWVDLTEGEQEAIYLKCNTPSEYTNAVIAAFKEKNK